jgi:hypothetical protein
VCLAGPHDARSNELCTANSPSSWTPTTAAAAAAAAAAALCALQDPACTSYSQALLYYKGYHAIQTHRIAHALWMRGQKVMAVALQSRMSEVGVISWLPCGLHGKAVPYTVTVTVMCRLHSVGLYGCIGIKQGAWCMHRCALVEGACHSCCRLRTIMRSQLSAARICLWLVSSVARGFAPSMHGVACVSWLRKLLCMLVAATAWCCCRCWQWTFTQQLALGEASCWITALVWSLARQPSLATTSRCCR